MTIENRQRIKYIISDFVAGNIAWSLFNVIRYYTLPYNYGFMTLTSYFSMTTVILGQVVFPLMMVVLYAISGYYNNVIFKSRVDEIINTYGVALLGSVIIFLVVLFNDNIEDRLRNYEMIAILWCLWGTLTYIPRLMLTIRLNDLIKARKISFNTLIIGNTDKAAQLAHELTNKYPNMGFNVVGMVSENAQEMSRKTDLPVSTIDEALSQTEAKDIHSFIIVNEGQDIGHTVGIMNVLLPTGKSVYITPDTLHYITMRPRTQMVSGEVLIDVSKSHIPASTQNLKRISDILLSAVILTLISPLMLVLALFVLKSSPGPVLYTQERIGRKKKPFKIIKFRTMYADSEKNGPALSSENDDRITKVGRVLRKYRLDELPQFWNVIKGDMSIVGPRPERDFYLQQIVEKAPYFTLLQQVRPGITSWGMVKYGYANSVDQMIERAKYDLLYIDNVSMIVDIKILLYTIETVITGKGI